MVEPSFLRYAGDVFGKAIFVAAVFVVCEPAALSEPSTRGAPTGRLEEGIGTFGPLNWDGNVFV